MAAPNLGESMEPDYKALYHSALKMLEVAAEADKSQSETAKVQREFILELMREVSRLRSMLEKKE